MSKKFFNNSTLTFLCYNNFFLCAIALIDFFFITCAKEPIYKKSSENYDFYVAKRFFDFNFFLCDDARKNMCDRHRPYFLFREKVESLSVTKIKLS